MGWTFICLFFSRATHNNFVSILSSNNNFSLLQEKHEKHFLAISKRGILSVKNDLPLGLKPHYAININRKLNQTSVFFVTNLLNLEGFWVHGSNLWLNRCI